MSADESSSRTSSPSISTRVRSFTILRPRVASRKISRDDNSIDAVPGARAIRERDAPESYMGNTQVYSFEQAIHGLDQSRTLEDRLAVANEILAEVNSYSLDTLIKFCEKVNDFLTNGSAIEARKTGFDLLKASAVHGELSSEHRCKVFEMATSTIDAQYLEDQVKTMRKLTSNGQNPEPFLEDLVSFLRTSLRNQYECLQDARRRLKNNLERYKGQIAEEKGLHSLLSFMVNIITSNPIAIRGESQVALIANVLTIVEKTTSRGDMKRAVAVLRATIVSSQLPESHLASCIEVFCAIYNAIAELNDLVWECLVFLLRSPTQKRVVATLLHTLALAPQDRHSHTVCGALAVLRHLMLNDRAQELPSVSFSQFIESLWEVHFAGRRIRRDCLKTISGLLEDSRLTNEILESNWDHLVQIILTATGDDTYVPDQMSLVTIRPAWSKLRAVPEFESSGERAIAEEILDQLQRIAGTFTTLWQRLSKTQRNLIGTFYHKLRLILPSACLQSLIIQAFEVGYCSPTVDGWQENQNEILELFILKTRVDSSIYCSVLKVLRMTLHKTTREVDRVHFSDLIPSLLDDFLNHKNIEIANCLAEFAVEVWKTTKPQNLEHSLELCWTLLAVSSAKEESNLGEGSKASSLSLTNTVSLSIVDIFLEYVDTFPGGAKLVFNALLRIAQSQDLAAAVRLPALRLLIRLRCAEDNAISVTGNADSLGLAATLSRTEATQSSLYQSQLTNRASELVSSRGSRSSNVSSTVSGVPRVNIRISNGQDRSHKVVPTPPLWMYPGSPGLPRFPPKYPSKVVFQYTKGANEKTTLKLGEWLFIVIEILQRGGDWEVYSYVLVHLPSQLSNPTLFLNAIPHVQMLRSVIVSQLQSGKFPEPPLASGVRKGDIALCLIHSLTMLLGHSTSFSRAEQDDIVRALVIGISGWDRTARASIQSLAICCHTIPTSISKLLPKILQKMSQIITQSYLAMDILEFLGGLARLPSIYKNFREEEFRTVFAICIRYLEHSREQRLKLVGNTETGADYTSDRLSGLSVASGSTTDSSHLTDVHKDLPQYVFALAYHVMTVWFLSLKLTDRSSHVGWITRNLAWVDQHGNERMEEQSQVTLDMMYRCAYLDLGETVPSTNFASSDGSIFKKTWLLGLSIVTVETAASTGLTQLTKRQASGTTYATYIQDTAPLPPHHVPPPIDVMSSLHESEARINIFPNHVFLQLTSTIAPTPTPMEAICLPDDEATKRAISAFDRNDTVDGYKVGVIFIGRGQSTEAEILANTRGSAAFDTFLDGLGTKVQLKGARFNTQGLDRELNTDGLHSYAWRDRVAEIIFHVPTMMPTDLKNDPQCVNKKRHIGNDFVNIVFNESGLPFKFDTFPSQFNCVNIIITPENSSVDRHGITDESAATPIDGSILGKTPKPGEPLGIEKEAYYTIQTISHASFPHISAAASYKLLPLSNLAALARQLALNSAVFSNVWAHREGGEHVSSWRNRLREIVKLRERFANTGTSTSTKFPGAKAIKTYVSGDVFKGRVEMGGLAEEEGVLAGLDFSRWAGPNPPLS